MESKKPTIFLTGATGLIGSYLLKILLENNHKIYVLARSKKDKTAKDRVIESVKFWDETVLSKNLSNLTVLEGDITQDNLGLDKTSQDILKNEVEEVYHSAATITFNLPLAEARKINLGGVKNVLDLALGWKQAGRLKKVNQMSTAYVCGDYKGVFREDNLELGQGFITTYEQAKFEAEKLVNEYRKNGLWIDIFRIPVAGAESTTGKTPILQAFSRMVELWSKELFDVFPGKDLLFDYIPVDLLCESIVCLSSHAKLKNQNYHPFSAEKTSLNTVIDIASKFAGFKKPRLVTFAELESFGLTPAQKAILSYHISFFNRSVTLDSTKTLTILRGHGFAFTPLNEEMLLKALSYFKDSSKK